MVSLPSSTNPAAPFKSIGLRRIFPRLSFMGCLTGQKLISYALERSPTQDASLAIRARPAKRSITSNWSTTSWFQMGTVKNETRITTDMKSLDAAAQCICW